jgi:Cyclin, C-terminal domain
MPSSLMVISTHTHREQHVFKEVLGFKIGLPTRHQFGSRYAVAANFTPKETAFLTYILELSVLDFSLNYYLISKVAAAAVHYTIQAMRSKQMDCIWTPTLQFYTGVVEEQIEDIVLKLRTLHWGQDESQYRNISK